MHRRTGRICPRTVNHAVSILLNTILSVLGLAFVIWLGVRSFRRTEDPAKLLFKWVFTIPFVFGCFWLAHKLGPFGPFVLVFMGVILSWLWTPHISEALARPLTSLFDGGNEPPDPRPQYSAALSKRKWGRPLEAIVEIRKQLDRFPHDYEGVMLLATIQAEDTQDLPSAEITLNHFCDRPDAPPKQVAAALTQLADWHLRLAQDPDSARAAFEKIIARFPGTDLAAAAAQRIAHLGGTKKILIEAHDRQPVAAPKGIPSAGLRDTLTDLIPPETDPEKLAAEYVRHLEEHPLDTEAREKLAVLYATYYRRLDLAANELYQLADLPGQPARRVAHWLNLLADLQIQGGADADTVRQTLERLIQQFPDLSVAEQARMRLEHLNLELKVRQAPSTKRLGVYEQNLGLKTGPVYGKTD